MTSNGCELSAAQAALDCLTAFGRAEADLEHAANQARHDPDSIIAANMAVAAVDVFTQRYRALRRLARQLTDGTVVDG